jgi:hypothetical protein
VRPRWDDLVLASSLVDLYRLDRIPDASELPPHQIWQAPLVLAPPDASADDLAARVERAGRLWLANHDLVSDQELLIARIDRPWFMAFLRATEVDEAHLVIGPIGARVLDPAQARPLWQLPLCYRESERSTSRALWAKLAAT